MGTDRYRYKISRPELRDILPRKRLFRLIDESLSSPALWVSGPPGAGKTSLIYSYTVKKRFPTLWYQADETDSDIATFFYYIRQYIFTQYPEIVLPAFGAEYRGNIVRYSRMFFDTLYSGLPSPFLIIIDSYQDAPAESPLHEVLRMAMEMLPEGIRIIVISRDMPTEHYSRLRAYGLMSLIEGKDLMFTRSELRGFLKARSLTLRKGRIEQLLEYTEGWIAGIIVLIEYLSKESDTLPQMALRTPGTLFDFFSREIFQKSREDIREFLLRISLFPEMTPAMAEALTDNPASRAIIQEIERKNFFISRFFREETRYKLHPLFRGFLISTLSDRHSRAEINTLRRKAAEILRDSGDYESAISLNIEAGHWREASRLIISHAGDFLSQGREQGLLKLINSLPEDLQNSDPHILYLMGNCTLPYDPERARRFFEKAHERFKRSHNPEGKILALTGIVNSVLFEVNDCSVLDPVLPELERLYQEHEEDLPERMRTSVVLAVFSALVLRRPGHREIAYWENLTRQLGLESRDIDTRLRSAFALSLLSIWRGDFTKVGMLIDMMRGMTDSVVVSPHLHLLSLTTEAFYYWLNSSPEKTLEKVGEGLALVESTGVRTGIEMLLEHGVAGALSAGDIRQADELLGMVSTSLHNARLMDTAFYHYLVFWKALYENDLTRAEGYLPELLEITERLGYIFGTGLFRVSSALLYSLKGNYRKALREVSLSIDISRSIKSGLLEFITGIVEAYTHFRMGNDSKGAEVLRACLPSGRQMGLMNFFGYLPEVMGVICLRALEQGIEIEYIKSFIKKRGVAPPVEDIYPENWPWRVRIQTFGGFKVIVDDQPLSKKDWKGNKTHQLLKLIVSLGGRDVSVARLMDVLWPETEGDRARKNLEFTLRRLRGILKSEGSKEPSVILKSHTLSLNHSYVYLDTLRFTRLCELTDKAISEGKVKEALRHAETAFSLYRGKFLQGHDEVYVLDRQAIYHQRYLGLLDLLIKHKKEERDWDGLIHLCRGALEIEPLSEGICYCLMEAFANRGDRASAIRTYHTYKKLADQSLGLTPSDRLRTLYLHLKRGIYQNMVYDDHPSVC